MANPTTYFGWVMPTSSSLVTNLPADFNTFGQGVDTSLQDLLGGTTGQVLSKTSATNMDFTWVTPTDQTPLTTKGDLFTFTTVDARLAVGANGETLVADSSTSTGLRYTGLFGANKNRIINGDCNINQRNFSSGTTQGQFVVDRFQDDGTGGTITTSVQQFTPGTAPVAGYEAKQYMRTITATQSAAGHYQTFTQAIEDVRTLAGQTATVSFWAKAATGTPNIGATLQQQFGSGGSSLVTTSAAVQTITTSWARYSFQIAVPSISGKTIGTSSLLKLYILVSAGTTISGLGYPAVGLQNNTFDIWGVQVEAGSVATPFQTATGTLQGELDACMRYYQRIVDGLNQWISGISYYSSSFIETVTRFVVPMRIAPSLVITTGTDYYAISRNGGIDTLNSLSIYQPSTQTTYLYNNSEASGTAGHAGMMFANNASSSIAFSAEL